MKNSNNYSATPVPKPDIKPVGTGGSHKYDGFVKPGDKDPRMQKIIEDAFDRIFGSLLKNKG